ncbi:hypothetical protein ACR3LR_10315 [Pantoea eucalypti]|uniref:hypothetical protein n=1 Tax=Pantoea eucalypti TaxID=470933 RepID=UPI00111D4B75|nr:hypothetical protein FJP68_01945 [Pantoea vagans]
MPSDHELVNFGETYELNFVLGKVGKRQTESNRAKLVILGSELKTKLNKRTVTHKELYDYVNTKLALLE